MFCLWHHFTPPRSQKSEKDGGSILAGNGWRWWARRRSARRSRFPCDTRRGMAGNEEIFRTKDGGRMHNCGRGGIGDFASWHLPTCEVGEFHVVEHRARTLRQFCQRKNQRGDLRSDFPFDYYSFRKTKSVQCGRQNKDSNPIKFPLDKRGVWVYTYHNGICPCENRRKRTVPPMGVVEAQRMESPGYRPCRILRIK